MEVQARTTDGGLQYYNSLEAALIDAKDDETIWKVSFNAEDGTRIRLIRTSEGWTYENVMNGSRFI